MSRFKPPHIIILSFLVTIALGTALLSLPAATVSGDSVGFVNRLFTATSATCVTGLIVKDTGSWSAFGQAVILCLFQIGGLGIMTFSTLFAVFLGRKLTIRDDVVVKNTMGHKGILNLKALLAHIVAIVLLFEISGAAALFFRWGAIEDWSLGERLFNSVFHSVSAFCNSGLSLFGKSFIAYSSDAWINLTMIGLIFFGGIGFVVIAEAWKLLSGRSDKRPFLYRISVQTKTAVCISVLLILAGALFIFFMEKDAMMAGAGMKERLLTAVFQSVTARTAGFNTLQIGRLLQPTLIFMMFLMFIGASPGSTGGGIKTSTFGVVIASAISMIKNRDRVWLFRKTVPRDIVRKAISIFVLSLGWIFLFSLILSATERGNIFGPDYYLKILFETVSAFGTVGLSTGITPFLTNVGKLLITITMFAGRIGPLTLALAAAMQEEKLYFNYPEEQVMVG